MNEELRHSQDDQRTNVNLQNAIEGLEAINDIPALFFDNKLCFRKANRAVEGYTIPVRNQRGLKL